MATATARPPAPAWVDLLERGLSAASEEGLDPLGRSALGDDVVALCRLRDGAQAEIARPLCRFEQFHGPAAAGAPSTVAETLGGCWRLDGWLDTEGGSLLTSALNPLMKPLPDDRRTASQRRASALLELCRRQLDGGRLPLADGQKPHLFVSAPVETLRGEPGPPGGELRWGGPVAGETVRRLACDAVCTEVTVGAGGVPLAVGPARKTVPAPIRRRLIARDEGCRFTGCPRHPDWCEAHHVRPRALGGPSTLENLMLLCRFHHRCVHEGGWRIRRGSDTLFEFVAPGARAP